MAEKGQALIEYVLLLAIFTAAALSGWDAFQSALGRFHEEMYQRRSGLQGMFP